MKALELGGLGLWILLATACGGTTYVGGVGGHGGAGGSSAAGGAVSGGGTGASGGSQTGGTGGTGGSNTGGSGGSAACPANPSAAVGQPCPQEGQFCGNCSDPCQFCNLIECMGGTWQQVETFPSPNCQDGGGSGGSGGAPNTGLMCGGFAGIQCPAGNYCDFVDGFCGATDSFGTCKPIPGGCPTDCPGVCGCDNKFYCNQCDAAQAGVNITINQTCQP